MKKFNLLNAVVAIFVASIVNTIGAKNISDEHLLFLLERFIIENHLSKPMKFDEFFSKFKCFMAKDLVSGCVSKPDDTQELIIHGKLNFVVKSLCGKHEGIEIDLAELEEIIKEDVIQKSDGPQEPDNTFSLSLCGQRCPSGKFSEMSRLIEELSGNIFDVYNIDLVEVEEFIQKKLEQERMLDENNQVIIHAQLGEKDLG